jgi:hypothetical protein
LVATGAAIQEPGIFLYALAEIRAHQFHTAGHQMDSDSGTSYVNIKIMEGFRALKQILIAADPDLCDTAETTRSYIISLMKIPLVQGLLRYSYVRHYEMDSVPLDEQERTMAESATFAATLLPLVHACDPKAAATIHANTQIGVKVKTDYQAVRNAISSVYECLGIDDCKVIGGVWDETTKEYKTGGYPCGMIDPTLKKSKSHSAFGSFVRFTGISGGLLIAIYFLLKYKNRIMAYIRRFRKEHSMQQKELPTSFSGNIAAVAEIS